MDFYYYLNYEYPPVVWVLTAVALACMLYLLIFMGVAMRRVRRRVASDNETPLPQSGYPPMSVIVNTSAGCEHLEELLNNIFEQDYPAEIEVIVVTDGHSPEAERIVGSLQNSRSNLYLTFTPENSRNLSRRKLAITLGIKAARFDAVVLTESCCRITSNQWLRHLGRHFIAGKEVVVGYAHIDQECDREGAFRSRAFDSLWNAIAWLSPAIATYPRRGLRYNLAYTRRLFFANKGFSRSLNLNYGDDDLFISEIASRQNSVVELSTDSILTIVNNTAAQSYVADRLHRQFTGQMLGGFYSRWMSLAPLAMWMLIGATIACSIIAWPSIIAPVACVLMLLATFFTLSFSWRATGRRLGNRPLLLTVVPLLLWHPFYAARYTLKAWKHRNSNYTWSN